SSYTKVGEDKSRQREQTRIASRRIAPGCGEPDQLVAKAVGDPVVSRLIDVIQKQGSTRNPGDQPPSDDRRLPRDTASRAVLANPAEDEIHSLFTRLVRLRCAQVAQPAKAMQLPLPFGARRLQVERRAAADIGDRACEAELPDCDFFG